MKPSLIALCSLLFLLACSEGPQNKNALDKKTSNAVVYGEDSIADIPQSPLIENGQFQTNVKASMAMFFRKDLQPAGEEFQLPSKTVKDTFQTCPEFRLTDSKNPALCSAVLVAPNLVLTAAHCMSLTKDTCQDSAFAFGFNEDNQTLAKSDVYYCKKIRALSFFEKGNIQDYALVELDRTVMDVTPVKVRQKPLSIGDSVYTLGYPLGTSKKYSDGLVRSIDRILAVSNLDEYAGNSGGPVFDKNTHELVGIVNSGEVDLIETAAGCQMPNVCKDNECMGENILQITEILRSLKDKGEAFASP